MPLDLFENLAGWSARQDWVFWLQVAGIILGALLLALLVHWIAFVVLTRLAARSASRVDDSLLKHGRTPSKALFCVMALLLVLPVLGLASGAQEALQRLLSVALTGSVGWLAVRLTGVLRDVVEAKYDLKAATDVRARQTVTRVAILRRALVALIAMVTLCLILMSIPSIRQIGVTLFASAGIAGLVAGLAARPAISNLIAGIQLAVTEPIRLEDSVIIEGEFGNVEENASLAGCRSRTGRPSFRSNRRLSARSSRSCAGWRASWRPAGNCLLHSPRTTASLERALLAIFLECLEAHLPETEPVPGDLAARQLKRLVEWLS